MNQKDINVIVNKLSDFTTKSELAAIITALDNNFIEYYDIFDDIYNIEGLRIADIDKVTINMSNIMAVKDIPDFLFETECDIIKVKDLSKFNEYIVSDSMDDLEDAAKNIVIEYGKQNGIENFDIDINDYVEPDFFFDWNEKRLKEEAIDMYEENSFDFENVLVEYLYNINELDDFDFEENEVGEPDYFICKLDFDTLIDIYIDSEKNTDINELIEEYIQEEGKDTFKANLNNEIEIKWDSLAEDCINIDGFIRYLSIDNKMNTVKIDDVDYYVLLYHQRG